MPSSAGAASGGTGAPEPHPEATFRPGAENGVWISYPLLEVAPQLELNLHASQVRYTHGGAILLEIEAYDTQVSESVQATAGPWRLGTVALSYRLRR